MKDIYEELRHKALEQCRQNGLLGEKITVRARVLTTQEAIGNPEGEDFPLQKGKERLMQAEFRGAFGQAFTDRFGDFEGSVEQIFGMPTENNFRRAVFLSALNAVFRHLGLIANTVHCRDKGPTQCAAALRDSLRERFGRVKITQVGFQPAMAQALAGAFPLRLLDLDKNNIGVEKFGVRVEGPQGLEEALNWADLLLVTGTTLANATVERFLSTKPTIFYGTTIAAAAHLMGWERFCPKSE
ncbi:MAG: Rossmann-like domain-containing protein [Syntrophobacteraceae bacterium]